MLILGCSDVNNLAQVFYNLTVFFSTSLGDPYWRQNQYAWPITFLKNQTHLTLFHKTSYKIE